MTVHLLSVRTLAIVALLAFCLIGNTWLVVDPVRHVLVQLPLLGLVGWLVIPADLGQGWRWTEGGYAPLLVALFGIAYWMLPRVIDASVSDRAMMLGKFASLPAIGAAVALGWRRAHPLLRGFVKAQAISMAGFMAFLFTHSPARLCNNYLIADQWRLGESFLWLAIALAIAWSAPLFTVPAAKCQGAAVRRLRPFARIVR